MSPQEYPGYYVIAQPCIGEKDQSCVAVCPVDCIHGSFATPQMYINPDECIGCGLCQDACPVNAIFAEEDLPDKWEKFTEINAKYFV